MKRFAIIFGALLLAATAAAQTTTTVTDTVRDITGSIVPSGQVIFQLQPPGPSTISGIGTFSSQTIACTINQAAYGIGTGQITSLVRSSNTVTATLVTTQPFIVGDVLTLASWSDTTFNGTFTVTSVTTGASPTAVWSQTASNSSATGGYISALRSTPGPGSCTLTQNTALTPAGTYYKVTIWPNFAATASFNYYALTATVDLSSVVPTPGQMPAFSFVDLFNAQTIGGIKQFTAAVNLVGGGALNGTFTGNPTFSGAPTGPTFTGNPIFTGNPAFTGTPTGTVAIKPAASDAVQYIGKNGNDALDGLSPGTAKGNADLGTAMAAAQTAISNGPGDIWVLPGSYTASSSLVCQTNQHWHMAGVTITYTGSGNLITCAGSGGVNLQDAAIYGPLHLLGSQTSGTVAIYLGSATANAGLTLHNLFEKITIGDGPVTGAVHGFGIGIKLDGNSNSGDYYNTFVNVASTGNLNQAWLFKPTLANHANSNRCFGCTGMASSSGFEIDGANDNSFWGIDSEANSTYGINFPGTQVTQSNVIYGGDVENNTTSDLNSGSSTNVILNTIAGLNLADTTKSTGNWSGQGNQIMPAQPGGLITFGCSAVTGSGNFCMKVENEEGGTAAIFDVLRTGSNAGQVRMGSPEYPAVFPTGLFEIVSSGGGTITHQAPNTASNFTQTATPLSGTNVVNITGSVSIASGFGTTPSIVNQGAGSGPTSIEVNIGTGGTATSGVLTMPAAPTGWSCSTVDMSTNIVTRETAFTITSVTLTAASAWTASDKLLLTCWPF